MLIDEGFRWSCWLFSFLVDKVVGMDILGGCGDGGVLFSIVFGFSLSMFSDLLGLRPKFGVQARYCGVGVWTATILEVGSVDGFGGVGGDILPYGCIRF